jgi:hypothetical protein
MTGGRAPGPGAAVRWRPRPCYCQLVKGKLGNCVARVVHTFTYRLLRRDVSTKASAMSKSLLPGSTNSKRVKPINEKAKKAQRNRNS